MLGCIRHIAHSVLFACLASVLACNYFAFQVELFEAEYERNQPMQSETGSGLASHSLTWESFDKDHAQKPFVFNARVEIECIVRLHPIPLLSFTGEPPRQLVRDKSPPSSFSLLA